MNTLQPPTQQPAVWGVINVTPDSFSDGGLCARVDQAVAHAESLVAAGAQVLDVGGESTRPGAHRISAAEESARVLPVITELVQAGHVVSIDTTRAAVARAAVQAGATIINDVSGAIVEPEIFTVAATESVQLALMHWRAPSAIMDAHAQYTQVVAEVIAEVQSRVDLAETYGLTGAQLIVDPGFGFAKNAPQNWQLFAQLGDFVAHFRQQGIGTLVGTSRKRFLGAALADAQLPSTPSDRDIATAATTLLAAQAGVAGVRVHDVAASRASLAVLHALAPYSAT